MRQTLHYHSAVASIKVCSFNAISICLRPVQPWFVCRYAIGPANSLGHDAGDVGAVHPAAVDAGWAIAPVCPKHQAKRDSTCSLVHRELLRKTKGIMGTPYLSPGMSVRARGCSTTEELTKVRLRSPSELDTWKRDSVRMTTWTNVSNWWCCSCFNIRLPRFFEHQHLPNTATGWWDQMTVPPHLVGPFWQSLLVQSFHSNTISTTQKHTKCFWNFSNLIKNLI